MCQVRRILRHLELVIVVSRCQCYRLRSPVRVLQGRPFRFQPDRKGLEIGKLPPDKHLRREQQEKNLKSVLHGERLNDFFWKNDLWLLDLSLGLCTIGGT